MPKLTLVIADRNISSWSLRPWLAMKMANIAFSEEIVMLGKPETAAQIAKVSPSGWLPCLLVDGKPVWDSLGIAEYLAEIYPDRGLWPSDPWARATARCVVAEMHSGFRTFPTELRMKIGVPATSPTPDLSGKLGRDVGRIRQIWRSCRNEFGAGGPFLFGKFCLADAFFAPVVSRFETYAIPVESVERAYMDAIWSLRPVEEWKKAAQLEASENASA